MTVTKKAMERIAAATKKVESLNTGTDGYGRRGYQSIPYPYLGITKERINKGSSGIVYAVKGAVTAPTQDTSFELTAANPYMGDIMPGIYVVLEQFIVREATGGIPWAICPFDLMYEGKIASGISANSTGTVNLWKDDAAWSISGTPQTITGVTWRWVSGTTSLATDRKVRIRWNWTNQKWIIDAMECV